jgi:hypothetical protein
VVKYAFRRYDCRNIAETFAETPKHAPRRGATNTPGRVGRGEKTVSAGQPGARSGSARQVQPAHVSGCVSLAVGHGCPVGGLSPILPLVPRPARTVISPRASPPPVPLRSDQPARLAPVPGVRSDSADARMRISPARSLPGPKVPAPGRSHGYTGGGCTRTRSLVCISCARARTRHRRCATFSRASDLHLARAREGRDSTPHPPTPPSTRPYGGMGLRRLAGSYGNGWTLSASAHMALFCIESVLGRGLPRVRFRVWFG